MIMPDNVAYVFPFFEEEECLCVYADTEERAREYSAKKYPGLELPEGRRITPWSSHEEGYITWLTWRIPKDEEE